MKTPCQWCGSDAAEGPCPRSIACPTCGAGAGSRCVRPSGHPADTLHADRIALAESGDVHECARCGAVTVGAPCSCARAEVQTAHEVQRLFEPVPTMRGQTTMEGLE